VSAKCDKGVASSASVWIGSNRENIRGELGDPGASKAKVEICISLILGKKYYGTLEERVEVAIWYYRARHVD
jgi:hypothetical protein